MRDRNDAMTEFHKRAIDLLCHKFVHDYKMIMSNNHGEEIEHVYEVWSKQVIMEQSLRAEVWKRVMQLLLEERRK